MSTGPKPLAEIVSIFTAMGLDDDINETIIVGGKPRQAIFQGSSTWTEEQWDAHDAKIAAEREKAEALDRADRARARRSSFEHAGFPARALDAAANANEKVPAIERVKAWRSDEDNVLVLAGAPGCGKTVAATWWALTQRLPPVFLRSTSFAASSRYDTDKRDQWLQAPALVLDDLGTEYADAKGNYLVDLDELIDTFYGDRRPLLITTNCDVDTFKSRYGSRIVDRIRESGSFAWIAGQSMRRKP